MATGHIWTGLGITCLSVATILIILGFATPYWLETDAGTIGTTQFEKLGLWEACFDGYSDQRDGFGRTYTGCRWLYSREYDQIRKWLTPGWFITTQALLTINVILATLGCIFGVMLILGCVPESPRKYVALTLSLTCYAIAVFMIIGLIYFGSHGDTDRTWLKFPTKRHLSWSFYVAAIGGIISILAGMCYTVLYVLTRREGKNRTAYRAHEMRHFQPALIMPEKSYPPPRDYYSDGDYHSEKDYRSERDYHSEKDYRSDRDYHDGYRSDRGHRSERSYRSGKDYYDDRSDRRARSDRGYDDDRSDRDYRSDRGGRRSERGYRDSHRSDRSHRSGHSRRSEHSHGRNGRY